MRKDMVPAFREPTQHIIVSDGGRGYSGRLPQVVPERKPEVLGGEAWLEGGREMGQGDQTVCVKALMMELANLESDRNIHILLQLPSFPPFLYSRSPGSINHSLPSTFQT